jgi:hypothetical protein
LRGLAAEGIVDESPDGRFGLSAVGACLRGDLPNSLRGAVIARGDLYYAAAAGLHDAVQQGGAAFEHVHGLSFFEYLSQQPALGAAFQGSMDDRSRQEAADVVASYDFDGFGRLVDVGGGRGILLEAILRAAPACHGTLLDRPPVVEQAKARLAAAGLAERCAFVAGDFFRTVPAGGDAYLLSRVIHNWDDESAIRILANCCAALGDDGTLLLVEAVQPKLATEQPAAIRMDLHMLTLLDGRERTAAGYEQLLGAAGFRLARVVPTQSPAGVSILEAAPAARPERRAPAG